MAPFAKLFSGNGGRRPRISIIAAPARRGLTIPIAAMASLLIALPLTTALEVSRAQTTNPSVTPSGPAGSKPPAPASVLPAALPDEAAKFAPQPVSNGLRLELEPLKRIYSSREGLMVKFVFTAQSRTKLCLAKDLLSQMQVAISRAGTGRLPLQPLVMRDNSALFREKMQVRWLEPGQSLTLRANLKRYHFAGGEQWTPGEYNVGATFNLCAQTPDPEVYAGAGEELPVRTVRSGWFMIMI